MFFETYRNLAEYMGLSIEERMRGYLLEAEILKVPVKLVGEEVEPLIEIGRGEFLFAERMVDFRVRKGLFERLKIADGKFREMGLALKIYEMYRPLKQQRKEFEEIKLEMRGRFPLLGERELWEKTTEFIADPDLCPPHSTGGAVDLTLVDLLSGLEVEMGTRVNALEAEAALFAEGIGVEAKKNRMILFEVLIGVGLAPMCTEWWHFSYGEAYWAAIYGVERIYGALDR